MIGIIDYGLGNPGSVANAFQRLHIPTGICREPAELRKFRSLILPGVGAFDAGMQKLADKGWLGPLNKAVLEQGKPFLGICLGMQMLGTRSEEGSLPGLGWLDAVSCRIPSGDQPLEKPLRLPHMGWNEVQITRLNPVLALDEPDHRFYFVHSYHLKCLHSENAIGKTCYGIEFDSAVQRDHIFGTQFHPEKSHKYGLRLLASFAKIE